VVLNGRHFALTIIREKLKVKEYLLIHQFLEHSSVISVYFDEVFPVIESYVMANALAIRLRD
jgi:hypothetical protein